MNSEVPCTDLVSDRKLNVLAQAKDMLHNLYVEQKTQIHNAWVHQAELAWRVRGVRVPYPKLPDYPTGDQVLALAEQMWQFVNDNLTTAHTSQPIQSDHTVDEITSTTPSPSAPSDLQPQITTMDEPDASAVWSDLNPPQPVAPTSNHLVAESDPIVSYPEPPDVLGTPATTLDDTKLGLIPSWLLRKRD